ncbi:unnamed protein product [Staurois parvus]|uniref:Uncharacterized protein n=1 Tax=Staurois parvus TaxID=386267 RepID=A0ABN9GCY7_9NEOB|nr:unnamed protein product [Staurois parvus]
MSCQSAPVHVILSSHAALGGLTIWKLRHCPRGGVSRGPHEMPLVPFFHRLF